MNQIDRAIEAGTKACELAEKNAMERSNERGNPYDLVPGTTAWQSAIDQARHSSQREE
jgi:hypothetical protein